MQSSYLYLRCKGLVQIVDKRHLLIAYINKCLNRVDTGAATHTYLSRTYHTVLCKSNANEFWRNSWLFVAFRRNFAWNDISSKFPRLFMTPIVLTRAIFRMIICFARWFIPNFRAVIRSSRKVAAIFRMIIHSSRKFDLLFINRPRAFLKHSSLTEIPKWPFQLSCTKEDINLQK